MEPVKFTDWLESYFLGHHPLILEVRKAVVRAAAEEWPVLITGETGTGKDMIARAIHAGSRRAHRLPEVLAVGGLGETAWSVLFGHSKGSFTGAEEAHEGIFKTAQGTSLLLEDIADLPLKVQPMLLRAIEHGYFRPLGAPRELHSDVRVVATTNVSLEREVSQGRFRSDLYQRISVLRIALPPLRDHLDDLSIYATAFLKKAATPQRPAKTLSKKGLAILRSYHWPRNVRELEHLLYRASVESPEPVLSETILERLLEADPSFQRPEGVGTASKKVDRALLIRTLEATRGNKREAARRLNIAPGTIYSLLRRHKIYA